MVYNYMVYIGVYSTKNLLMRFFNKAASFFFMAAGSWMHPVFLELTGEVSRSDSISCTISKEAVRSPLRQTLFVVMYSFLGIEGHLPVGRLGSVLEKTKPDLLVLIAFELPRKQDPALWSW